MFRSCVSSMLFTKCLLGARCRVLLSSGSTYVSHSATKSTAPSSMKGKVLLELKKMIKIQLVLIPVVACVLVVMYPIPSESEEKRMRLEYEQHAGWKT